MRPLTSKEDEEKRRKRNQVILVVILGFVMVASTLGFAIQNQGINQAGSGNNVTKYNGFTFTNQNGLWVTDNYVFHYTPQQVSDIGSGIATASSYQGMPAYIYSESTDALVEVQANLGQIAQRIQEACPDGTNCTSDIPIKTCSDNFIIIRESNINSIKQDGGCVYIEGTQSDLLKLTDQFLFKVLGIR